jgi:predicted HTH transcriptional regulator
MPRSDPEILRRLIQGNFVTDNLEGGYNVTNLGAILLAKDLASFSTVSKKSVRIIKYSGSDKRSSEFEEEINRGYALGFSGMMKLITARISEREKFDDGVRKRVSMYPEIAIREIVANALIHQDFTIGGAGPIIEIFSNRIEVINPGNSLIDPDRMLDERRSRNESLASTMRSFGICEERGGGLDKTVIELEKINLPAPEIIASENSMRVILSGPKEFSNYTKQEKLRACFFHCVLRWIARDYMSNSSLRERFKLGDEDYQAVSAIITESSRAGRIAPADQKQ